MHQLGERLFHLVLHLGDLDRKPVFLHDNSVPSLEALVDSSRGDDAPHPFFLDDTDQRKDVVTFLRSLGTN